MIKQKRHRRILATLRARGIASVDDLCDVIPDVSRVTIRRDIVELAGSGALRRTRGGAELAARTPGKVLPYPAPSLVREGGGEVSALSLDDVDAIVLPPIESRGAEALRRQIRRRGLPFVAESAPQDGGVYVGPDDWHSAIELGRHAGRRVARRRRVVCLLVSHGALPNTIRRTDAFERGFAECGPAEVTFLRVDGGGTYKSALAVAADAFAAHDEIGVVYGVNDHSALAGLDAAERSARPVRVYASGGERPDFIAGVAGDGPLEAVSALFPSVVGAIAIDTVSRLLGARAVPERVITPAAIVSRENLTDYYEVDGAGAWTLRADVQEQLIHEALRASGTMLHERTPDGGALDGPTPDRSALDSPTHHRPRGTDRRRRPRVAFMPHFPAHDWYRTMFRSMRQHAARHGLDVALAPPRKSIAEELSRLRRQIALAALARLSPGETIIIGEGAATLALAEALAHRARERLGTLEGVTVVTNALEVLETLAGAPGLRTILTGGELQSGERYLVGPSLGALFERMRADHAFLSVAGVSRGFGISAADERRALVGSRFVAASRATVALADHTLIGADANHRIVPVDDIDAVVTDDGSLPVDRQTLRAAGVEVLVAVDEHDTHGARDEHDRRSGPTIVGSSPSAPHATPERDPPVRKRHARKGERP